MSDEEVRHLLESEVDRLRAEVLDLRRQLADAEWAADLTAGRRWPPGWLEGHDHWQYELAGGRGEWIIRRQKCGKTCLYILASPAEWHQGPHGLHRTRSETAHSTIPKALSAFAEFNGIRGQAWSATGRLLDGRTWDEFPKETP